MSAEIPCAEALAKLSQEIKFYESLFMDVPFGWAYHQVVLDDEGVPVDYTFLKANNCFELFTGLKVAEIIGRRVTEVIPGIQGADPDLISMYGQVALTGEPMQIEIYFAPFDRWYNVVANCPKRGFFNAIFEDITQRKKAELERDESMEELARSNRDLEQFAYVASHDLQEPLRMVSSYTELLGRRYRSKLDDDADRFIDYAVDGARRMQTLINDLLEFSRVGRQTQDVSATDLNELLSAVLKGLAPRMEETRADITCGQLPMAMIHPSSARQVLQNLITNALKFHGEEPPRIKISGRQVDETVHITIKDEGIGIAGEHHDRIFSIFQRLHRREEYAGTGIGLALVKRIVEHHGGSIRLDSSPGEGATFTVSLPAPRGGNG